MSQPDRAFNSLFSVIRLTTLSHAVAILLDGVFAGDFLSNDTLRHFLFRLEVLPHGGDSSFQSISFSS